MIIDCQPRTSSGQPAQSTTGVVRRNSSHAIVRVEKVWARGFPGIMWLIARMKTGTAKTMETRNRRVMSIRAGLLSLIPNVLPVAIGFGTLGLFGVPINVGTSLIAAIAIGIAIDDTVHYMARNAMELDRHHDTEIAMAETVRAEGPAIVTTAFALAGGFVVFVLSSFMPLVHFGAVNIAPSSS